MGKIAAPGGEYDAGKYWENRLEADFSLSGVGYLAYGERFNRWLYRAFTRNLEWAERRFDFNWSSDSILECGFGTGFFLDYYHRRGNRNFAGVDLTEVSVSRVKERYPKADLRQADLGAPSLNMGKPRKIVTAFAVLLHITDDPKFQNAIANLCNNSSDYVLITDVFPRHRFSAKGRSHYVLRSRKEYRDALAKHGFEVAGIVPIFKLLHYPKPSPKWFFYLWNSFLLGITRIGLGQPGGWVLYKLDSFLLSALHLKGSMNLMVARRKQA